MGSTPSDVAVAAVGGDSMGRSVRDRLVELKVIAVGVSQGRHATPGMLRGLAWDLHAGIAELLDRPIDPFLRLEGEHRATAAGGVLANVQADAQIARVELGPVSLAVDLPQAESISIERDRPFDVVDGQPDD
jgi:hypothetical protein